MNDFGQKHKIHDWQQYSEYGDQEDAATAAPKGFAAQERPSLWVNKHRVVVVVAGVDLVIDVVVVVVMVLRIIH